MQTASCRTWPLAAVPTLHFRSAIRTSQFAQKLPFSILVGHLVDSSRAYYTFKIGTQFTLAIFIAVVSSTDAGSVFVSPAGELARGDGLFNRPALVDKVCLGLGDGVVGTAHGGQVSAPL